MARSRGPAWLNPYDRRVWQYVVDVAAAAAKVGFDEIQFDYVRFPSDGDLESIVYPMSRREPKERTIERFLAYASRRLKPLGVRVSADLFGLAATRDLGVGQPKRLGRHLDAIYPMVYPSHYVPGEYHLTDPEAFPAAPLSRLLADYQKAVRGMNVRIVPWLQDFSLSRTYGLDEVTDQVDAARRAKAGGFMLWNPLGVYTQEARLIGRQLRNLRSGFQPLRGRTATPSHLSYTSINHGTRRKPYFGANAEDRCRLLPLLALVALAGSLAGRTDAQDDGCLVVQAGRGIVSLNAKGFLLGRFDHQGHRHRGPLPVTATSASSTSTRSAS